jgi:hypothetical protein
MAREVRYSPLGKEKYFLHNGEDVCSVVEKNDTWLYKEKDRNWVEVKCSSKEEAEKMAANKIQELIIKKLETLGIL